MVSLAGDQNRGSGGWYCFNSEQSLDNDTVEDSSLVSTVLSAEEEPHVYTLPTTGFIIFQIICIISLASTSIALAILSFKETCIILNIFHISVWLVFLPIHSYYRQKHRKLLLFGYLEFYRKTTTIRKMPFMILSIGNTVLLCFLTFSYYLCQTHNTSIFSDFKCCYQILFVVSLETLILLPVLITFCVLTVRFNMNKVTSDVHCDEIATVYLSHGPIGDIGYR
ncbi:transmembrane protein 192-like [Centruroides sculpturatus]|uniref:transmembrane protein 192-like n=1 Tax=Centruroides sculpturatus TaxID=218467 RepID=UPI000C6D5379|nr:transmembrane protein 192-like [Centruroides sculpturatus]